MSRYTRTIVRCDGCGRTDVDMSEERQFFGMVWVSICEECAAADRYICHHCKRVHDDEHQCEVIKRMIAESEHFNPYAEEAEA